MVAPQIGTDSQWVNTPWADGSYDLSETPESASMQAVEELLEKLHAFAPWSAIVGEVLPQGESALEFD